MLIDFSLSIMMIDDGTGCMSIRIPTVFVNSLAFELRVGSHVLVAGPFVAANPSRPSMVQAMQMAELDENAEAVWMLEVLDAERGAIGFA